MSEDAPLVVRGAHIPASELQWRFSRSSGPGGQSVNTTDSRVELLLDVAGSPSLTPEQRDRILRRLAARAAGGVVAVSSSRERSQWQNRRVARDLLRSLLDEALAPDPPRRRATRPSRAAVERRLLDKRRRGETKRLRRPDSE